MLLTSLALLTTALQVTAKTCLNTTVEIPVTSRNGVFDKISTPQTNLDAAVFSLSAARQGGNGTEKALSGYKSVEGEYKISIQYCMPSGSKRGGEPVLQILTHGIGFDKTYASFLSPSAVSGSRG